MPMKKKSPERRLDELQRVQQEQEALQVANEELRVQAEELVASRMDLEAAHARYQQLFDEASDGYVVTDSKGIIQDTNEAAARLFGHGPAELARDRRHRLFDYLPATGKQLDAILADLHAKSIPAPLRVEEIFPPTGNPFWVAISASASFDNAGRITTVRWLIRDITERRRAEEALRESESRYCAYFNLPMAGIAVTAPDKGWVDVNPAICAMLGYAREELLHRTWTELTYPEDLAMDLSQFRRVLDGEIDGYNLEKRFVRKDQTIIWVDLSVHCVHSKNGNVSYFVALLKDITDRKRAEEALRNSEERFRAFVAATSDVLYRMSPDWSEMRHLHSKEFLADTEAPSRTWLQDYIPPADQLHVWRVITEAIRNKNIFELEPRVIRKDGILGWTHSRAVPLLDEHGNITEWFGTAADITVRKRAEEQLKTAKDAAESARAAAEQANRAKDHFLAVLSHELRTPLTPVMMSLSMLQDRQDLERAMRESLEMIRSNVELEARLIDDLLDVTRIARGKIELTKRPIELCKVIERAVEVCNPDIEARRVHFGVDLGQAAPYWVEADLSRLQQVFWNLLKNAIKFTPHGGCVGIRCRRNNGQIVVEVNDSGIGIEPEALPRVFDAFEQAERSITRQFGGLGLGLAISKALVELHGGEITAHSEGLN